MFQCFIEMNRDMKNLKYERLDLVPTNLIHVLSFHLRFTRLRFYHYLFNENSNRSIQVIVEDSQCNQRTIIVTVFSPSYNKWYHSIRKRFFLYNRNSTINLLTHLARCEPPMAHDIKK
jgi:hypothetical protein